MGGVCGRLCKTPIIILCVCFFSIFVLFFVNFVIFCHFCLFWPLLFFVISSCLSSNYVTLAVFFFISSFIFVLFCFVLMMLLLALMMLLLALIQYHGIYYTNLSFYSGTTCYFPFLRPCSILQYIYMVVFISLFSFSLFFFF